MKTKKIVVIAAAALAMILAGYGVYRYLQSKKPTAGLRVESNPDSIVFVDNLQVGSTPVEKIFKPGEVTVKLIPSSPSAASLGAYQTKVRLTGGVYTVIRRDFGDSESSSAGDTITLEPQSGQNLPASRQAASLSVITSGPDAASVLLDGQPQGFTPLLVSVISPGDHLIAVSAPGFTSRSIQAKAVSGYKLNLNVKLSGQLPSATPSPDPDAATLQADSAATASPTPKPSPSPSPKSSTTLKKPYVEIKDTPTGFLRVRQGPGTASKEIGRVNPGDRYSLLDQSSGWYQIKVSLEATSSGWISAQYADKFE